MDAGFRLAVRLLATAGITIFAWMPVGKAADFRTQNFIVMAPSPGLAQAVGEAAEGFRRDLADHWLGHPLPDWPSPCPIRVIAGNLPAQGVTQYNPRPVSDFQMEVVGTPERILDSVLPHEVTHTILATHFGRPLPRWADEGICTTVEHVSERQKHEDKLREFLRTRRGIAMNKLFLLTEYPNDVLPMYAQGYSVCQFLIAQRGPRQFVGFLGEYMQRRSWTETIHQYYGYDSLAELQDQWLKWVSIGNGPVDQFAKANLSAAGNGNVALAISTPPQGAPVVQLASNRDANAPDSRDGWYGRLRSTAAQREPAPTVQNLAMQPPNSPPPPRARNAGPPSIYAAAQPQPEQGAVPGGQMIQPLESQPYGSPPPGSRHWR